MIVRRFDRATGIEVKPVSVEQAVAAITRALHEKPSYDDVETIRMGVRNGCQHVTASYCYVPDADPPSDDQDASATESAGEGSATKAA